jgi:hypothetical protein
MIKKILAHVWHYWKWLCVALVTSFVLLVLATAALDYFKGTSPQVPTPAELCIEEGGRWNANEFWCEKAA